MGHREELLRRFHLGPEDLEANRRGMLSQRQVRYLVQSGVRNLLGSLIIGLALAAILYGVASKPLAPSQWILAAALAAAALTIGFIDYLRTRRAAVDLRVECLIPIRVLAYKVVSHSAALHLPAKLYTGTQIGIRGTVRVNIRGRAGWYLVITGRSFKLPVRVWDVKNDESYRGCINKTFHFVAMSARTWQDHFISKLPQHFPEYLPDN